MADQSGWVSLSDGSTVAVVAIGDPATGPLVILTRNAPGVVEPSATWSTDTYRVIVDGSCAVDASTLRRCQFRALEASVAEGELVHGPEVSAQVLVVADRRYWRPESDGASARENEIAVVVGKALSAIAA